MKKKVIFICILLLSVFAVHAALLLVCSADSAQAEVETGCKSDFKERLSGPDPVLSPVLPLHKETSAPECIAGGRLICPHGFQFYHSGISPPSV